MAGGGLMWKVVGTGAAVGAGIAARKGITATWRAAMGTPPPTNPEDPDVTWQEAFGWAVLSGAAVGVARLLATRKAADYWRRSTGSLPKGLQSVAP